MDNLSYLAKVAKVESLNIVNSTNNNRLSLFCSHLSDHSFFYIKLLKNVISDKGVLLPVWLYFGFTKTKLY